MKLRRIIALLLCILLLSQTAVSAAQTAGGGKNVLVVMECSGSLHQGTICSDPNGYRYEATAILLDLLCGAGNQVGAIVFNSTPSTSDASEESMQLGMRLNTGLMPLEDQADAAALMAQIEAIPVRGYTDIGTPLLEAAEQLQKASAENGMESVIILFTDGATQTKDKDQNLSKCPVFDKSVENREKAVEIIRNSGIALYGVSLGADEGDDTEVLELVRTANTEHVAQRYIPVKEASSLTEAFQRFFSMISGTEPRDFDTEVRFTVPGVGVSDVRIAVTVQGATLQESERALDSLSVQIDRPDANASSGSQMVSRGKNYAVYEIRDPEAGPWCVRVECPGAQVQSSILLNSDLQAETFYSVSEDKIQFGESVSIIAKLYDAGQPLTSETDYTGYECRLRYQKDGTEEIKDVDLVYLESAEGFAGPVTIRGYGTYYVWTEFSCGESITVKTPMTIWDIPNDTPDAPKNYALSAVMSLLQDGTTELNLLTLVTDKNDENLERITIDVDTGDYPKEAVQYDDSNKMLYIDGVKGGSGKLTVTFTDDGNASAVTEVEIIFKNNAAWQMGLIVLAVVLLLLLLAFFALKRRLTERMGRKLAGYLLLTVPLRERSSVQLKVNAQSCVNRTLRDVLKMYRTELVDAAEDRHCTVADVDVFMKDYGTFLSGVKITAEPEKNSRQTLCSLSGTTNAMLRDKNETGIELNKNDVRLWVRYERYE